MSTVETAAYSTKRPPCIGCGSPLVGNDSARIVWFDESPTKRVGREACHECHAVGSHTIGLGRSIRRFVRRAEVAELVETFRRSASHSAAWDAVDRLAALALEGT